MDESMSTLEFKRKYQGEFTQPDTEMINLWCLYFYVCELHDRGVCRVIRDGIAVPTTGRELALVNRYASGVRRRMRELYAHHILNSGYKKLVETWPFDEWKRGAMTIDSDVYSYIAGEHIVPGVSHDALCWRAIG